MESVMVSGVAWELASVLELVWVWVWVWVSALVWVWVWVWVSALVLASESESGTAWVSALPECSRSPQAVPMDQYSD